MKKIMILGSFLLLGAIVFGQTVSSKPIKEKKQVSTTPEVKPLSETQTNQPNTTRSPQTKVRYSTKTREIQPANLKKDNE
jgi:hypothetical protein